MTDELEHKIRRTLRVDLEEERGHIAQAVGKILDAKMSAFHAATVQAREMAADMTAQADELHKENRALMKRVRVLERRGENADLVAPLRAELAALKAELAEAKERADRPQLPKPKSHDADELKAARETRHKERANG